MAGGIANAQENWNIPSAGFFESFFTPWVPVNRVVGVLKQVGRIRVLQSIGHRSILCNIRAFV
jgi:hypothetical protein